jgi:predicted ribosome quality control (RQC) complex YloA/Tae2 family protein
VTLSLAELSAVVQDLAPRLAGGRIERIDQPLPDRLILSVWNESSRYWLLVCAHPRFSRAHLLTMRPEKAKPAAGFCNLVRQHMTSVPISSVGQWGEDRIVVIDAVARDKLMQPCKVSLIAELRGVGSNIILCDGSGMILGSLHREESASRRIVPGEQYVPLPQRGPVPEKALRNRFVAAEDEDDPLALSRAIQAHYGAAEAEEGLRQLRAEVTGRLRRALRAAEARLRHAEAAVRAAEDADSLRRIGDLLQIHVHEVERGAKEVTVPDLFAPGQPEVTIALDPVLSPQENVQRWFKRYRKARDAGDTAGERLEEARKEAAALEAVDGQLADAGNEAAVADISRVLDGLGVGRPGEARARRAPADEPAGPRRFVSADGLEILVSRNQRQNDRLTFSIARGNDWWVHLVAWPGPHVIVRQAREGTIPQESLLDAAHLAVHFSRIRGAGAAEVVYTQCKNVRRARGAGPGKVNYAHARNLRVRMEEERIHRLLDSR